VTKDSELQYQFYPVTTCAEISTALNAQIGNVSADQKALSSVLSSHWFLGVFSLVPFPEK